MLFPAQEEGPESSQGGAKNDTEERAQVIAKATLGCVSSTLVLCLACLKSAKGIVQGHSFLAPYLGLPTPPHTPRAPYTFWVPPEEEGMLML